MRFKEKYVIFFFWRKYFSSKLVSNVFWYIIIFIKGNVKLFLKIWVVIFVMEIDFIVKLL